MDNPFHIGALTKFLLVCGHSSESFQQYLDMISLIFLRLNKVVFGIFVAMTRDSKECKGLVFLAPRSVRD